MIITHPIHPEEKNFLLSTFFIEQSVFLTVLGIIIIGIVVVFIFNRAQKEHTILRNFPVIGYLRYIFEDLGIYLRQYFYASDREELPFNRAERSWVYRAAKNVDTMVGFGSTRDLRPVGTIFFLEQKLNIRNNRLQ